MHFSMNMMIYVLYYSIIMMIYAAAIMNMIMYAIFFPLSRLICEKTVEENILKKADEKRLLGDIAIEGGNFNAAFFKKVC